MIAMIYIKIILMYFFGKKNRLNIRAYMVLKYLFNCVSEENQYLGLYTLRHQNESGKSIY